MVTATVLGALTAGRCAMSAGTRRPGLRPRLLDLCCCAGHALHAAVSLPMDREAT